KGVAGVAVTLYEADCTTAIKTMNSNTAGDYLFDGLVPNDYCVGFEAPQGYALTSKDTTDDSKDSDVNPDTGKTVVTSLESGEADMRWDAGIYQLSSIGDKVWYDNNHNGIQDADEPAVKNVRVSLYRSDCETVITQTYSDVNGIYRFTNLEPNQYCVGFDALPIGYQFTPTYDNTGAGSELDCNVDPGTGKTPVITLPHSTNDMTWDMGIIPKCKDELDRNLLAFDDEIAASTTGSATRINILDNDYGNLDIESIKFVSTIEGEVMWNEGTAVAGTSAALDDTLVVPGEGVWHAMRDGTITFEAEDGFTGIPSPVYYVVNCKQGSISNIAQVKITTNCTCDTYEQSVSDSVPTLDFWSMLWTLFVISGLGIFFAKKELESK
ncbi:MAG: hypothetical protein IE909_10755, partial [Campylobacterales bacterium]|nr:hypothetical protein [Campylobacterales bacterium]